MLHSANSKRKGALESFIGPFVKTFLAYAIDDKIRERSASGGVASALIKYLLESNSVDAVVLPKVVVKKGFAYGVWTIITDPSKISKYAGSVYAPVFGLGKIFNIVLNKFRRIAVTAVPCHAKAIRRVAELRGRGDDIFIIGLYCLVTPSVWATKYALKYFGIYAEDVKQIKFRGHGWPGYTTIKLKNGETIRIQSSIFFGSGFGWYFHSFGCHLCSDHTNVFADISLADPWTLPHEPIKRLGGVTLVVVRSWRGLEVLEGAVRAGYVKAVEVDPIFAVQYTTLLKLSRRVLKNVRDEYLLPPGFTTMAHELAYGMGNFLARREGLWPLLKMFHKVIVPGIYFLASLLDHKVVKTRWGRIHERITRIQKLKASRYTDLASHQASP